MRAKALALAFALAAGAAGCDIGGAKAAEAVVSAPSAERQSRETGGLKTAVFAAGCFWGVEGVFSHVKGVKSAVSGYHGGTAKQANYKAVSSGLTNHAEAVRVTYDPSVVRYDELLRILFSVVADPSLKNRQGPDVGTQYRSAIVPQSTEQSAVAVAYLKQLGRSGLWDRPIATRIEKSQVFYPAEAYHQDFMEQNPRHGYIRRWDAPKVAALKRLYPSHYRAEFQRN